MDLGLRDRVVIVTGGSAGIGLATVETFAREGARVAACARDLERLQAAVEPIRSATGAEIMTLACDVTRPDQVEAMVRQVVDRWGGVDVLVNNAGRAVPGGFEQLTDADWQADLEVKLFSQIRCSRAVLPHFKARGRGSIVNVNAIFGKQPDRYFFATSVNRAACIALTKTLAREAAAYGVRVNSVNIGFVVSAQWENIRKRRAPDLEPEAFFAQFVKDWDVPLGRFGQPEEAAAAIVFLASDRASYITGAVLDVDGGMARYL
ncbi:MAG: SDR family oxidoreductase [Thermaerobacter sp.]|nr:short chain dehydrogenase [Bacillota bacterium]REJ38331.1 MAG: short chain dehydrogenase [Bacillota bacterium]